MKRSSGRHLGTPSTGHRMANPWQIFRNQDQAMSTTRLHMTFPGIGHIDIRRLSHLLTGPMCRAAPRRPYRFLGVTAESKP
jgi:hypothetical protein